MKLKSSWSSGLERRRPASRESAQGQGSLLLPEPPARSPPGRPRRPRLGWKRGGCAGRRWTRDGGAAAGDRPGGRGGRRPHSRGAGRGSAIHLSAPPKAIAAAQEHRSGRSAAAGGGVRGFRAAWGLRERAGRPARRAKQPLSVRNSLQLPPIMSRTFGAPPRPPRLPALGLGRRRCRFQRGIDASGGRAGALAPPPPSPASRTVERASRRRVTPSRATGDSAPSPGGRRSGPTRARRGPRSPPPGGRRRPLGRGGAARRPRRGASLPARGRPHAPRVVPQ
jgi:hypothetical protein